MRRIWNITSFFAAQNAVCADADSGGGSIASTEAIRHREIESTSH